MCETDAGALCSCIGHCIPPKLFQVRGARLGFLGFKIRGLSNVLLKSGLRGRRGFKILPH